MIDVRIGDSRVLVHDLADNSIDCCVTSPPYWGLRDYKTESIIYDGSPDCQHEWGIDIIKKQSGGINNHMGNNCDDRIHYESTTNFCFLCGAWRGQFGLEPTPELYLKHLWDFFDDVKLKLKDTGNCFVNLGDTFYGSPSNSNSSNLGNATALGDCGRITRPKHQFLQPKSLCCIPSRFAWGMIERGWILRNSIIWHKQNHMPESVTDRLTKSHEVVYHFVKQQKYYYNLDAIRKPHKTESIERYSRSVQLGANATQGKILQRDEHNLGYPRKAPKWFIEGQDAESFGSPRARTQRKPYAVQDREEPFIEYRQNLPPLNELKTFLNEFRISQNLTMKEVDQRFGNMAAHHWFGGECYPSPIDWIKLKEILNFDDKYDKVMIQEIIKPSDKINNPLGKNPGDCFSINETITVNMIIDKWKQMHPEDWNLPDDYWSINTSPFSGAHFAVFPVELVRRPILAGCPEGGTVFDPFAGSGTVGEFCRHNNRNAILFDLNPEYKQLIDERVMLSIPELSQWSD